MAHIQGHVEMGLGLLKRSGLTEPDIIEFVANHHERFDGSGLSILGQAPRLTVQ